jgi:dihydrofolate synthase/folylpolyglutamate synthase
MSENDDERDDGSTDGNPLGDLSPFAGPSDEGGFEGTNLDDDSAWELEDSEYQENADQVFEDLLARIGENNPQPRLAPTRRAVELLGDPQRSYPIIHVTGTNGKTSTSRIAESILRAYGLRTGLLTSPHLERLNERIVIDGRPISNRALAANWDDIQPFLTMVDDELAARGEQELTFFEALTVLAYASFADAPVDVAVIEVGMGGEWDSTNVADGQVAVFTPIALDHTQRLGNTISQIAATKAGIVKPVANVVSAVQSTDAAAQLEKAAELTESTLSFEGKDFSLESTVVAVGGQVVTIKGLAGRYDDLFLPLFGDHQAHNATLAVAAVESFIGGGDSALERTLLAEGFATVTSPGRLQIVGTEPTVLVDAAHNPHGALALASALGSYFTFDEIAIVLGVLADKDARGIIAALLPIAARFDVTQSSSDRASAAEDLTDLVLQVADPDVVVTHENVEQAIQSARAWASEAPRRAVVVTGSITLVGEAITLARAEGWKP